MKIDQLSQSNPAKNADRPSPEIPYRELYREGLAKLTRAGDQDSRIDARILLEEVCGTDLQTLLVTPELAVSAERAARYRDFIRRRAQHEPTAMILGHWEFMGLPFRVTKDTLIPEQDTERLVELALEYYESGQIRPENPDEGLRILDLCTGSGCILLSCLHYMRNGKPDGAAKSYRDIQGTGTDLSEPALGIARHNAADLGLADCTRWLGGDLFRAVPEGERFDLIVSNPPYIPTGVIPSLPEEVKSGEPRLALDGGGDGLSFYRRIAQEAGGMLSPSGTIMVEIGYDQGYAVTELFLGAGYRSVTVYKDYGGNDRVVVSTCLKS